MQFDNFMGEVQHRARLSSKGEAGRVTEAVLRTLAERLSRDEVKDLASQLPLEIAGYLFADAYSVRMSLDEFFKIVSMRGGFDLPESIYHVRVVLEVLQEAVSPGEIADIRAQLPPEWAPLFESGSQGQMQMEEATKS
jgi:uncharacterized protein (DUF2267 family)